VPDRHCTADRLTRSYSPVDSKSTFQVEVQKFSGSTKRLEFQWFQLSKNTRVSPFKKFDRRRLGALSGE